MERDNQQMQAARYAMLSDVVLLMAKTTDFQRLLGQFVGQVKWVLDFDRCTLALLDNDAQAYQLQTLLETRRDVPGVAEASFDCIMCGLCASRCPAEEVQFNVAILARRLNARYRKPRAEHLKKRVEQIEEGVFEEPLRDLMGKSKDDLKELYSSRESEPQMAEEDWTPQDARYV